MGEGGDSIEVERVDIRKLGVQDFLVVGVLGQEIGEESQAWGCCIAGDRIGLVWSCVDVRVGICGDKDNTNRRKGGRGASGTSLLL